MSRVVLAMDLPPARDFLLSGGAAGLAVFLAAIIASCAALYSSRRATKRFRAELEQSERHHERRREDAERATAIARCWDRWWQVVETASLEPATSEGASLGLGPEVTLTVLRALLADAERLGDDTLIEAVATYREQLLLVLVQQGGPLARFARTPSSGPADPPPRNAQRPKANGRNVDVGPAAATPPAAAESAQDETSTLQATMLKSANRRRRS